MATARPYSKARMPKARLTLDVTPAWWCPRESLCADAAEVLAALSGARLPLLSEVRVTISSVELAVAVLLKQVANLDELERQRLEIVARLDALAEGHEVRRRTLEILAKIAAERAAAASLSARA